MEEKEKEPKRVIKAITAETKMNHWYMRLIFYFWYFKIYYGILVYMGKQKQQSQGSNCPHNTAAPLQLKLDLKGFKIFYTSWNGDSNDNSRLKQWRFNSSCMLKNRNFYLYIFAIGRPFSKCKKNMLETFKQAQTRRCNITTRWALHLITWEVVRSIISL